MEPPTSAHTEHPSGDVRQLVELADYRRQVFAHYAAVRGATDPRQAWERWRARRDALFITHPQSPLEAEGRVADYATPFAPYDPDYRVIVDPRARRGADTAVAHDDGETTRFVPVAILEAHLPPGRIELTLYWLPGYGGGFFLPFRDATSGRTTYGGGRYLLDTVKGADLGARDGSLILDFNFAYHPSCVYSSRWSCPLAPPDNHVQIPVPVGEQLTIAM